MGWGDFVEGGIELVVINGDHFSMFQEPGVSQMARHIAVPR
jgi:thioesterase domain-containing protein